MTCNVNTPQYVPMASLFSILFCLLLLPLLTSAQSPYRNITLGSYISTGDGNRSWVSPSGEFAFGFYPTSSNASTLFYVAIWFNRIPDRTIVWTARTRGSLTDPIQAPAGSTARLAGDGRLLVENQQGEEIWRATPGGQDVTHASMLDTGNFVIAGDEAGVVQWQSFDSPTDTLLPSQPLLMNSRLSSRLLPTNFSDGRFQLRMQSDGNLVLYTIALPTGNRYSAYWASSTVGSGYQLVLNSSGVLYFITQVNGTSARRSYTSNSPTGPGYFYRLTLDSDGGLRSYAHPRNESGGSWSVYGLIPRRICTAFPTDRGSGPCGLNSYCRVDQNGRAVCSCPLGYSFVDPSLPFLGCKQDSVLPQRCGGDQSNASTLYDFREMDGVDWPDDDYEELNPITEIACQEACLVDCFCAVAVYERSGSCGKKKLPLSNGRDNTDRKIFIKVARTNVSSFAPDPNYQARPSVRPNSRRDEKDRVIVAISVLLGSVGSINLVCLAAFVMKIYPTKKKRVGKDQPVAGNVGTNLRLLSYKAIVKATNNFREELGSGAFGSVFKGSLPGDSISTSVAVKRLDKVSPDGHKEFQTELRTISKVHHKNLVPLLGYCDEGLHRMLVYEFMSNGSLAKFLFSNAARPSWDTRMQIAFGIARGLVYLHEECSTQIIHCDIKPENVLVDEHLNPRISDFGLAKLLTTDQSRAMTGIRGTRGYVAPEWFKRTEITAKVDVFSYGVLLMELICCRKNVVETADDAKVVLTDWAYDCYLGKQVNLLVEGDEEALYSVRTVERLVKVAIWCIQEDPALRPQMKKVTQMLEGTVEVPIPPNPSALVDSFS